MQCVYYMHNIVCTFPVQFTCCRTRIHVHSHYMVLSYDYVARDGVMVRGG